MFVNRLALAALGVACVTAAAGGAYVATRHNAAPVTELPGVQAEAPLPAQPVQETEEIISEPAHVANTSEVAKVDLRSSPRKPATQNIGRAPVSRPPVAPATPNTRQEPRPAPTLERSWPTGSTSSTPPPNPPVAVDSSAPHPPPR